MMVAMMMPILLRWMIFLDAVMERKHFPGSVLGFSTAFGGGYVSTVCVLSVVTVAIFSFGYGLVVSLQ